MPPNPPRRPAAAGVVVALLLLDPTLAAHPPTPTLHAVRSPTLADLAAAADHKVEDAVAPELRHDPVMAVLAEC